MTSVRTRLARSLRRDMTAAERAIWALVRGRRFAGYKFRRQFPIDRFVADFACWSEKLIVEIDGIQHREPRARFRDAERTEILRRMGFEVVRFTNAEVMEHPALVEARLLEVLRRRVVE